MRACLKVLQGGRRRFLLRPLRRLHGRMRDALTFGILVAARLEFYRFALDLLEPGPDIVEPVSKSTRS
ncbi:hypothetical protein QO004_001965 [Rhizobium mesoamericanum]|nr:hypothetical protein [Rhizobium mesoamericanum]